MPELTITAIARKAGVRPSTLRYYEKIGLLPLARRAAGRRRYDFWTLKQLELIAYAKRAGFSLAQIQALQESASRGNPPDRLWRDLGKGKAAELESGRFLGVTPLSRLDLEGGNPDTSGGKCSPTLRRAPGFVSAGEDVLRAGSIPSAVSSPSVCSRLD